MSAAATAAGRGCGDDARRALRRALPAQARIAGDPHAPLAHLVRPDPRRAPQPPRRRRHRVRRPPRLRPRATICATSTGTSTAACSACWCACSRKTKICRSTCSSTPARRWAPARRPSSTWRCRSAPRSATSGSPTSTACRCCRWPATWTKACRSRAARRTSCRGCASCRASRRAAARRWREAMHDFLRRHRGRRRGLVILISDFYDPAGYREALDLLRYNHFETVVIQISAPEEIRPSLRGDVTIRDVETGEERELTVSPGLLDEYRRRHAALLRGLEGYCRERGIPCFPIVSDVPFDERRAARLPRRRPDPLTRRENGGDTWADFGIGGFVFGGLSGATAARRGRRRRRGADRALPAEAAPPARAGAVRAAVAARGRRAALRAARAPAAALAVAAGAADLRRADPARRRRSAAPRRSIAPGARC